ncbi:MAG: trypsin-like serine peptidase [Isosphaeraceae bacterium]
MTWTLGRRLHQAPWRRSNPAGRKLRPCFDGLESRKVFSLTPVPSDAASPFTAVVKVEGTFPNGESYVGTGFLVDGSHVLTAGHLVYDFDDGGFAMRITVIPDLYGSSEPFGQATMTGERTTSTWQAFSAAHPDLTATDAQDVGLITLDWPIGDAAGFISYGYSDNLAIYKSGTVFETAGYPADPASGYDGLHMAYSSGPIAGLSLDLGAIQYSSADITTYGGQSGSPLWAQSTGVVSGIVIASVIPMSAGRFSRAMASESGLGIATRITPAIYDDVRRWIAADTPPAPPAPAKPPLARAIGPVWHFRRKITSIGIIFDQPLNPGSAKTRRQYAVLASVVKRVNGTDVLDRKPLRIARVGYNSSLHRVRIYLARPHSGPLQVVVYPGLVAASGAVSTESSSWIAR